MKEVFLQAMIPEGPRRLVWRKVKKHVSGDPTLLAAVNNYSHGSFVLNYFIIWS